MKFPSQDQISNLYMFTGKGGVGKSELAKLFYRKLKKEFSERTIYIIQVDTSSDFDSKDIKSFEQQKDEDGIITLHLRDCATEYMANKIHSKKIASWISSTNFYRTIVSMLPGLNYLIYFGKILKVIEDEDAIVILDAPSSGHLLAMFQSLDNFKKIFKVGPIHQDILKMLEILNRDNYLSLVIVSQLEEIIINETFELQQKLSNFIKQEQIFYFINSCYSQIKDLNQNDLPKYLEQKVEQEKNQLQRIKNDQTLSPDKVFIIPYIFDLNNYEMGDLLALSN